VGGRERKEARYHIGENNCVYLPNPRRVGNIVVIQGPLDGPLYMDSIYSNKMHYRFYAE